MNFKEPIKRKYRAIICYAAYITSKILPIYRKTWLVTERPSEARDNGFHFFKYLNRCHPEIRSYYLLAPTSPDYSKVASVGKIVRPGSFKHALLYFNSPVIASAHSNKSIRYTFYPTIKHHKLQRRGIYVFLQHGITSSKPEYLSKERLQADLFISACEPEYRSLQNDFGYVPDQIIYTGFARYGSLFENIPKDGSGQIKNILIMPTWRKFIPRDSDEEFVQTEYFKKYNGLINSPALNNLLIKYDCNVTFFVHPLFQPYRHLFSTQYDRISIADPNKTDIQQLFINADLMITDYSSVFFDMAYLNKPILYYHFDFDAFRAGHFEEGWYDYKNGLGPSTETEDELLNTLEEYLTGKADLAKYQKKAAEIFTYRDDKNCERIFEAINKALSKN